MAAMQPRPNSVGSNSGPDTRRSRGESIEYANRPMSSRSNATDQVAHLRDSSETTAAVRSSRIEPVAYAESDRMAFDSRHALSIHNPAYQDTPGNRQTFTFTDAELSRKLHQQMSSSVLADGDIVTADIVEQEVLDRRAAQQMLDQEIANLESQIMARQLEMPLNQQDAGASEDAAWRTAFMNDKLDYMRPESYKPYSSLLVFIVCSVTMAVEIGVNGGVESLSANPLIGPTEAVLLEMGAKDAGLILGGQQWRLITPIILHVGVLHLFFNMLGLWFIGVPIEREFGSIKIGAIFGLFGAAWADLIQNWGLYKGTQISMLLQLVFFTVLNLVLGLLPFLDNFAHIGGLVCGCVLGLGLLVQTRYYYSGVKKGKRAYQIALMLCSAIVFPGLLVSAYTVFFTVGSIDCDWCQYVSCVPLPPGVPYNDRWWNCDNCYVSIEQSESQGQNPLNAVLYQKNNTLIFNCPLTNTEKSLVYPSTITPNTTTLLDACVALCL